MNQSRQGSDDDAVIKVQILRDGVEYEEYTLRDGTWFDSSNFQFGSEGAVCAE